MVFMFNELEFPLCYFVLCLLSQGSIMLWSRPCVYGWPGAFDDAEVLVAMGRKCRGWI